MTLTLDLEAVNVNRHNRCMSLETLSMTTYENLFPFDPMTLILKSNLDMVKMYLHTKMKSLCKAIQKL